MHRYRLLFLENPFALQSHSYRKFFYGSFLTGISDWMEITILNWVVFEMTSSAYMLALLNVCRLIPVFAFSIPAGYICDLFNRQKVLKITYFFIFISSLVVAYSIDKQLSIISILVAVTFKSILQSIEVPVRNAFLSNLVSKKMLPSAISIQTTLINLARMIGPALAGLLLVSYEPGLLLYLSSIGPFFVIISLTLSSGYIENVDLVKPHKGKNQPIKDIWPYIFQNPKLVSILLLAIAPMIFGFPYTSMLPLFSKELLGLGPDGFGLLLSASSFGAVVTTLFLSISQPQKPERLLIISALCFGSNLCLFVLFNQYYILNIVFMFLIGMTSQYYRTLSRVLLQVNVDEEFRGRVLSIALMDRGYIPLGALLIGWVGSIYGPLSAGLFMGLGCCIFTICITLFRKDTWYSDEKERESC